MGYTTEELCIPFTFMQILEVIQEYEKEMNDSAYKSWVPYHEDFETRVVAADEIRDKFIHYMKVKKDIHAK